MIAIAPTIVIPVLFNVSIHDREQTIANGETLFLELAPADPRSLMQGDYMQLRYAVENAAQAGRPRGLGQRGYLVLRGDDDNVAEFVRFRDGESPEPGERLMRFHRRYDSVRIVPDAFFFQERHGEFYEDAQYGAFRFDDRGRYLLVGLADSDRALIKPD